MTINKVRKFPCYNRLLLIADPCSVRESAVMVHPVTNDSLFRFVILKNVSNDFGAPSELRES